GTPESEVDRAAERRPRETGNREAGGGQGRGGKNRTRKARTARDSNLRPGRRGSRDRIAAERFQRALNAEWRRISNPAADAIENVSRQFERHEGGRRKRAGEPPRALHRKTEARVISRLSQHDHDALVAVAQSLQSSLNQAPADSLTLKF